MTERHSNTLTNVILLAGLLCWPALVWASEKGGQGPSIGMLWFNFITYIVLLSLVLRKPLSTVWAARSQEVQAAVGKAADELKMADSFLITNRDKLVAVDKEIASIQQEVQRETAAEIESIKAAAQNRKALIAAKSSELCQIEEKSALADIRREITDSAFVTARAELGKRLNADNDGVLREAVIQKVANLVG